ncbi:MAG: hypothetical protein ABW122_00610 [Ilumatobacteraceae bacterium]
MRDVVMLAVITAFFALCLAYVRWCDHIIGPDPMERPDEDAAADERAGALDVEEVSA